LTKVCENIIIILTPFGWRPLHLESGKNPYQKHRPTWFSTDLRGLGFYEHPKWINPFRRMLQRHIILRHLITPLSLIIYIRKCHLVFILAWRSLDLLDDA
jgi:hypothetical protein